MSRHNGLPRSITGVVAQAALNLTPDLLSPNHMQQDSFNYYNSPSFADVTSPLSATSSIGGGQLRSSSRLSSQRRCDYRNSTAISSSKMAVTSPLAAVGGQSSHIVPRRNVGVVNIRSPHSPLSLSSPRSSPVRRKVISGELGRSPRSGAGSPVIFTRERMRKYHAVIRLNNSNNTSSSDMSTLDLSNLDVAASGGNYGNSTVAGSENIVPPNPALYYTIDSRRLASKHKKSLRERQVR